MQYSNLISVTGMGGLYELVSNKKDGAIVRSLEDNTTKFAPTRQHSFSHLESIEVYTERDNTNLSEVFKAMENSEEVVPSEKEPKAVKSYFEKVFPEMDFERVYASDMKKMVKWFQILKKNNVEIPSASTEETEGENTVETEEEKPAE